MRLFIACALFILAGCASSPISAVQSTNSEIIDRPDLDIEVIANIGESLAAKGIRTTGPALQIVGPTMFNKGEGEGSVWTCGFTVQPGNYFESGRYDKTLRKTKSRQTASCFGPILATVSTATGESNWNCRGTVQSHICLDDRTEKFFLNSGAPMFQNFDLEQDFNNLRITNRIVEWEPNFVQEFIYNGRIDNHLKFIYRELSQDIMRDPFRQEVQYDLDDSKVIGFKGLRLEVMGASNTQITYKLISNFE